MSQRYFCRDLVNLHLNQPATLGPFLLVWFLSVICAVVVLLTGLQATHTHTRITFGLFPFLKQQLTQSSDRDVS